MGPVWDFDWGFGFISPNRHFVDFDKDLLTLPANPLAGSVFFSRFFDDPEFKAIYKNRWEEFRLLHLDTVLDYIDINAENIANYQALDNEVWNNGVNDYMSFITELKQWMHNRANYIDNRVKNW